MESILNPPIVISSGALITSILSSLYLNNRIDKLQEDFKKSDENLVKLIEVVSKQNNQHDIVLDINDEVKKQTKIINQLRDTNNELLDRVSKIEQLYEYQEERTNNIVNFLREQMDYSDPSIKRSNSLMTTPSSNSYRTMEFSNYSNNFDQYNNSGIDDYPDSFSDNINYNSSYNSNTNTGRSIQSSIDRSGRSRDTREPDISSMIDISDDDMDRQMNML